MQKQTQESRRGRPNAAREYKKPILINFPSGLYEALWDRAAKNGSTFTGEVLARLEASLLKEGR